MPDPHAVIPQAAALTLEGEQVLFPQLPYDIHRRAASAVADPQLQQFVNAATYLKDVTRKRVCRDTFGDRHEAMRELAGRIKQHTLDHLDYYLEQFIDRAQQAGAQIHFATDAAEANAVAVHIAKQRGCKLCVKSKSMVTEEVHLLPQLEAVGCETIETDLGEFILQLDGDAPSHIVTPMIHKDRTAVARAFVRELGADYTEDAEQLTRIARDHLRDKYRQADLGISGGNFLVAATGGLVICTNEGNGRLCTSVPPIHIAFVGIEKLVPDLSQLAVMLKLLARTSTGQPLTCYTHMITGPKRDREHDGPREVHIVLVDNGRTKVLQPETREMLRCIRCGACLNACPVYRKIGGHSYGAVYSGPIGAILTPMLKGLANYKDLPHASSLCGACYEACPVKINIPKYLIQHRNELVKQRVEKWSDRVFYRLWAMSLCYSLTYRLGGWAQRFFFRAAAKCKRTLETGDPYAARGWLNRAPGPVAGWTRQRDMPTPPAKNFRQWWREHQQDQNDQSKP